MADADGPQGPLEALRNAARGGQERFLVALADRDERERIATALTSEGFVLEATSLSDALGRLADESFDVAILDLPAAGQTPAPSTRPDAPVDARGSRDPLAASRELRPFSDIVLIGDGDPVRVGQAFAREVAAVLPRPLPDVEVLLRAHIKRLAGFRRSRTRGQLVLNAFAGIQDELRRSHPALTSALDELAYHARQDPAIAVLGDAELARAAGAHSDAPVPDAVVVDVKATDEIEPRLGEARSRGAGAALVVIDAQPSPDRLATAIYAGARAYLPRSAFALVGRIAASAAARRHGEAAGVRIIELLARHGVLVGVERSRAPAASHDVDARLIADATVSRPHAAVVPTGHEVLVVDDEAVVLTVLREALRRGGYRVTTAASAEEAIDLMRKRRFDLVLTDKNLPGASGLDVLRAARKLTPAPAIVLITGYSSYDSAIEAMDVGALDYIEKPIRDVDDLRFRIRRALSRRDEQLARRKPPTTAGKAGRVLLVEVEGQRRQLLAEYLGKAHHVTAAKDGDEALMLLKSNLFDLVLADRHLPGVSGLRVIEHAQQILPHCASVLYTAYPSYESVQEAFAAGVDAYLVRPSDDLKKLGEKVAEALGGRGGILLG